MLEAGSITYPSKLVFQLANAEENNAEEVFQSPRHNRTNIHNYLNRLL